MEAKVDPSEESGSGGGEWSQRPSAVELDLGVGGGPGKTPQESGEEEDQSDWSVFSLQAEKSQSCEGRERGSVSENPAAESGP